MPDPNSKEVASLRLLDTKGQPLNGKVDVQVKSAVTGQTFSLASVDASKDVVVPGLAAVPPGLYHVTVTPTDGSAATTHSVTVPPNPITPITVQVTRAATTPVVTATNGVGGSLTLDHGLPAAGLTVRVYNIGFGGQATLLGQTAADAQGNYSLSYQPPGATAPNLQVRAVDAAGNEVQVSSTTFGAAAGQTLNLVVPAAVQPLVSEFQRLSADVTAKIGGIASLAQAREGNGQQDLTLLSSATNWDARLLALAATAAQQTAALGLTADATTWLYALYRVGLPTDPQQLALVPAETVQAALQKASDAGVVTLAADQIVAATTMFRSFATTTRLAMTTPGTVSPFKEMLTATLPDATQQSAFADLYFANPTAGADLWTQAAALNLPQATVNTLQLQGRLLHLTINNAPLAAKLQQDVGSLANIAQLADKDYHNSLTWKAALTAIAGQGGDAALQTLIPAAYKGATAADRLESYSADLARKVRVSFPTQSIARMIETKDLPHDEATAPAVTAFLRAATPLGYELGRTPLNAFLANSTKTLPAPPPAVVASVKTLHRMYQITPSTESLNTVLTLGFQSAQEVASMKKSEFLRRHAAAFPSPNEADLVYAKAQQVSSVTFNVFAMAKTLDTSPPIPAFSPSDSARQDAKQNIITQFPSMATLFGSTDYCQCDDCRSVLSPGAYFVDLLQFLDGAGLYPEGAPAQPAAPVTYMDPATGNPRNVTPLDILIGNATAKIAGRRSDLAALPLTCANTNTLMPYIDLVNEILEYYIVNSHLDAGIAYDTGDTPTGDLTAEPQHVLTQAYGNTAPSLKTAQYPLNLPFDLWIETVRGFLGYSGTPLAQVLETLRPVDELELFPGAAARPYYRSQILAEALGLSPSEYCVLTVTDATTHVPSVAQWFELYGYSAENKALAELASAKTLATSLGLSYQEITDLITTGFLNPSLYSVLGQLERFGISLSDAFSYTGQPGSVALTAQAATDFESLLDSITTRYSTSNPAFNARAWLATAMPANYASTVLVLRDSSSGCNFTGTTLQYADGTPATALDFLRMNLFVRLWKKLGWTLDETDRAVQLFFPAAGLPAWADAAFASAFSSAWKTTLVYLAHLDHLNNQLEPSLGRNGLLPLWGALPTHGTDPLYAQLFLTPSVLTNNPLFDDPAGRFPSTSTDSLATYQAAVQGVLQLTADDLAAILADAATEVDMVGGVPAFTLVNLSICYRYSLLSKCLDMSVRDVIALKTMTGLNPFQPTGPSPLAMLADDILYNETLRFVKQAGMVASSGLAVTDLKYLLRHQFDPIGAYGDNANARIALVQSLANGLQQIERQNAVAADLAGLSDSNIDQQLSRLFAPDILKALFAMLTNERPYQVSLQSVLPADAIDPTPLAGDSRLVVTYVPTTGTETLIYQGLLLDWQKVTLLAINNSPTLQTFFTNAQQAALTSFSRCVNDILGVWSSLAEYEATPVGAVAPLADPVVALLMQTDAALSLAAPLRWLGYRGVLTDTKKAALLAVSNAPGLKGLLDDVQQQSAAPYARLLGSLLTMWTNMQSYETRQTGVAQASAIDPAAFADYPSLHLEYDAATQTQVLRHDGVLTDANRIMLAGRIVGSAVLGSLLQVARDQAMHLFHSLSTEFLTVTDANLDQYAAPFVGLNAAAQQKRIKAELVSVFVPLRVQQLSRQFSIQALTADLESDPSLTGALITNADLLSDPTVKGKSLIGTFLSAATAGVSAVYLDNLGVDVGKGTASTVDLADTTNPNAGKAGTDSARFEGYLQVASDGVYRFIAELGDANARAVLRLDSPASTTLFGSAIIDQQAAKDGDEASQFVQLTGGLAYHFTVEFSTLGAHGARLLVQGENLAKGPLSQISLYPMTTVSAVTRARVLLAKVLKMTQAMNLDQRELNYFTTHAARFNNLALSALPTQASDDSIPQAVQLFSQFLALADYADLRHGLAGESDGLVDVFAAVGQLFSEPIATSDASKTPSAPWARLAQLTRRDPQVVREVASYLSLIQEQIVGPDRQVRAVADFDNNRGVRRIWEALQLVQLVGIPVSSLTAATAIVVPMTAAPDVIATNFKNAIKARCTPDRWNSVAKSIFDKLRQKKRDALVSYLVHSLALDDVTALFEYFLIDSGMEPVVQTSRLRLALSSVQTFVQRCLLNLESGNSDAGLNISPAAIEADWWEWMKRYRVWEANRKIFLFPENWMEPELRLDKTDLFESLESALLQGDVTTDLVEDALYSYLTGLDVRARLDIVSMYLEQNAELPAASVLHVLGRTYGKPAKYFSRTYTNGSWSGWEGVTLTIEGDHVALAVWQGRLNLFWVTFTSTAVATDPGGFDTGKPVSSLTFDELKSGVSASAATLQVKAQLHWSDYVQGKWSTHVSSDPNKSEALSHSTIAPNDIRIHISIEKDAGGNEGAIRIHLDASPAEQAQFAAEFAYAPSDARKAALLRPGDAFRIAGKNSDPEFGNGLWEAGPRVPYFTIPAVDATVFTSSGALQVDVRTEIATDGTSSPDLEQILNPASTSVRNYALLTCSNEVVPPFVSADELMKDDAGSLSAPFFFKDVTSAPDDPGLYTFFVEPTLTEKTMSEAEGWAIPPSTTAAAWRDVSRVHAVPLAAQMAATTPRPVDPGDTNAALYRVRSATDWVSDAATTIYYGGARIDSNGGVTVAAAAALTSVTNSRGVNP